MPPLLLPSPPGAPRLTFMRSRFLDSFVFTSPAMAAAALALGRAGSPSSSSAAAAQAGGEPGEEAVAARLHPPRSGPGPAPRSGGACGGRQGARPMEKKRLKSSSFAV